MKILLQSAEFARRSVNRLAEFTPDWALHKRMRAVALMLGYEGWEALVASSRSANMAVSFDQDLTEDAFAKRMAEMAKSLSKGLNLIYAEAFDLVSFVRPLSDVRRDAMPVYVFDDHRDRFQAAETDVWWVSVTSSWHPMSLPGFDIAEVVNLAALSRARLERLDIGIAMRADPANEFRKQYVLLPHGLKKPWARKLYLRTNELMHIEPVPPEWMLKAPSSHHKEANEWLRRRYPDLQHDERRAALKDHAERLKVLRLMADIGVRPSRPTIATLAAREAAGKQWYWPLVPLMEEGAAWQEAEKVARLAQSKLDESAGTTVFSVYAA
jgi:hypothetical protein